MERRLVLGDLYLNTWRSAIANGPFRLSNIFWCAATSSRFRTALTARCAPWKVLLIPRDPSDNLRLLSNSKSLSLSWTHCRAAESTAISSCSSGCCFLLASRIQSPSQPHSRVNLSISMFSRKASAPPHKAGMTRHYRHVAAAHGA